MKDTEYALWMLELDRLTIAATGMSHDDLPDLTYIRDLFDDGATPKEALIDCIDAWNEDMGYEAFSC